MTSNPQQAEAAGNQWFSNTHWTVVLAAGKGDSGAADTALEQLCRTYWQPLYAFVRRRGHEPHDAQDLTQEFFARLLSRNYLSGVDRSKGKFRSFLLAALDHFLANDWRRGQAQKRGGQHSFISWDDESQESEYAHASAGNRSCEQVFEKQWAMALLEQVLQRLRKEFVTAGKGPFFEELKIFLTGEKRAASYQELADKLSTTEAALKMAVSRMRKRYGELLREEIANTVARSEEIEDELRALFAALG